MQLQAWSSGRSWLYDWWLLDNTNLQLTAPHLSQCNIDGPQAVVGLQQEQQGSWHPLQQGADLLGKLLAGRHDHLHTS